MGTQLDTWQLVDAPAVVPQPYGIFSQAEPRLATDDHWKLGIKWQSQGCFKAPATTGPCIDDVDPLDPDNYCVVRQFEPFTIYSYNDDSVIGRTLDEHRADAVARLIGSEQRSVETQVWAQMVADAGAAIDLSAQDIRFGLGYVEQYLAREFNGMGVIHMTHLTATLLWDALVVTGGKIQTVHGTPVVVGAGYDTSINPLTDDSTIVGTGPMVMYRGDIDTREQAIAMANNRVSFIAQRDYVFGWDCGAVRVLVPNTPAA